MERKELNLDFRDYVVCEISKEKQEFLTKSFERLQDSSGAYKGLVVEIDATHGGYVNLNHKMYLPEAQARAVDTFIKPYPKPILKHHESSSTPIGRVQSAAFIPIPVSGKDAEDLSVPKSKIRVRGIIVDEKAAEEVARSQWLTVSVGGRALKQRCSICNQSISECDHMPGQEYDGKRCYFIVEDLEYTEVSFVNEPADVSRNHCAKVVHMEWVDVNTENTNPSVTLSEMVNEPNCGEVVLKDTVRPTDEKPVEKVQDEASITKRDKIEFVLGDLDIVGVCGDCGDEYEGSTVFIWQQDEIDQVVRLDNEFVEFAKLVLGDKELSPEQRKKLRSSVFCGPNRTFPVPDCKHAATAMAYLNFPNVKAKYSASVRARIASCIRAKAKALGCPMAKDQVAADEIVFSDADIEGIKYIHDIFLRAYSMMMGVEYDVSKCQEFVHDMYLPVDSLASMALLRSMLSWDAIVTRVHGDLIEKLRTLLARKMADYGNVMHVLEKSGDTSKSDVPSISQDHDMSKKIQDLELEVQKKQVIINATEQKLADVHMRLKKLLGVMAVVNDVLSDVEISSEDVQKLVVQKSESMSVEQSDEYIDKVIGCIMNRHVKNSRVTCPSFATAGRTRSKIKALLDQE